MICDRPSNVYPPHLHIPFLYEGTGFRGKEVNLWR